MNFGLLLFFLSIILVSILILAEQAALVHFT